MLLLALGWKVLSGLSLFVQTDAAGVSRTQVMFAAREPEPVPPPPPGEPVASPTAQSPPASGQSPRRPPRPADAVAAVADAPSVVVAPPSPDLFDESGRPRLAAAQSDRWDRATAAVPGSADKAAERSEVARRLLDRRNPVEVRSTRFAGAWKTDGDLAEVAAQEIARAQNKIAEFLFGKDIRHARARPSPDIAFSPSRHARAADLGSEATGDAYKAAPIAYQAAPGLDGEASRRIREQVAALETAYARCDRVRLRELMQPLLWHLDELQKAEAAYARGADPVRAEHMLPNVANGAYDMARRALWYVDSRMAGCDA